MLREQQDILLQQPEIIDAFTQLDNNGVPFDVKHAIEYAEHKTGNYHPSGDNKEFIAEVVTFLLALLRDTLNERPATNNWGRLSRWVLNSKIVQIVVGRWKSKR